MENLFDNMFNKKLYKDTFSVLKAPDNTLLEVMKMKKSTNKTRKFTAIKAVAAAVAAVMVLTIGVGAANGWDYGKVFSGLFGDNADMNLIGHAEKPQVTNMNNPDEDKMSVEVLGVAGDDKVLYTIIEFTGEKPDFFGQDELRLHTFNGELISGYSNHKVLEETADSITIAYVHELYTYQSFEKGTANFKLYTGGYTIIEESDGTQTGTRNTDEEITFDVEVDFDFSNVRTFNVNEMSNIQSIGSDKKFTTLALLKTVELTPISVRFTTDNPGFEGFKDCFSDASVLITFKNGDTMSKIGEYPATNSSNEAEIYNSVVLDTPINLDDVYSVTVGDIELVL